MNKTCTQKVQHKWQDMCKVPWQNKGEKYQLSGGKEEKVRERFKGERVFKLGL